MSKRNPYSARQWVRQGDLYGLVRFELNGVPISVSATGSAVGFGSAVIGEFPTKQLFIRGSAARLSFVKQDANIIATWSGDWALGSAPTADAVLTDATDFDVAGASGGFAIGPAVAGVIAAPAAPARTNIEVVKTWAAADEVNLNLLVDAASITDDETGVVKVYGTIDFMMAVL